jgi:signal transduction histidine kinase
LAYHLPDNLSAAARFAIFVALYVLLDWASFILPLKHLNVTPWNPAPALGLLFMIRRGHIAALALFTAIVASDIFIRNIPGNLEITLLLGTTLTAGYAAMAWTLKRYFPDGGLFGDRAGLLRWSAIVIFGSFINSLLFISTLLATGLLPKSDWGNAVMRFWVGDGVGIFVAMPLLWWLQDEPRRLLFRTILLRWETLAYSALTLLSLWIAFVPGAEANFRYFYVLFLPVVWAASRQGLAGAVFCVSTLQLGLLVAGLLQHSEEISLFELQMRAFLLALVGFLIGMAVDEQRRAAAELRLSLRLAAAGEMAGALAHELNQPLTALSAYGSASKQLLERGANADQLRDVIQRMIDEAGRAADVVRRLRDFFRTGATRLEQISLPDLVDAATAPFSAKAREAGIDFWVADVPPVVINADRLQLEVVLRNLLANAFEAVADLRGARAKVVLSAADQGGCLVIEVADSGPGVPTALAEQIFEPFASTKSSGLGLGLAISRAIAEAHGGSLTAEIGKRGCFRLTLPLDKRSMRTYG